MIVSIDGWNPYKICTFSMILTQYINLFVADFMPSSSAWLPHQYLYLTSKRKRLFQSMISSSRNHQYQKLAAFICAESCGQAVNCFRRCIVGYRFYCCYICCFTFDNGQEVFSISKDYEMDTSVDDSIFGKTMLWNNRMYINLLTHAMKLYETKTLINKSPINDIKTKYITLAHEYKANKTYQFDVALMNKLREESTIYQSNTRNKRYTVDEIMMLLILLILPSFRLLLHEHIIHPKSDFIYFYQRLCFMDYCLDLPKETRIGYTILNCRILSGAPIIFTQNIDKLHCMPGGECQGAIYQVNVRGKFAPMSLFGTEFVDIFIVIIPEKIEIVSQSIDIHRYINQMIDIEHIEQIEQVLQKTKQLITSDILSKLLFQRHGGDASKIKQLSKIILSVNDGNVIAKVLLDKSKMEVNMDELYHMIWLEFINNDIGNMPIIRLRKACQQDGTEQVFNQS